MKESRRAPALVLFAALLAGSSRAADFAVRPSPAPAVVNAWAATANNFLTSPRPEAYSAELGDMFRDLRGLDAADPALQPFAAQVQTVARQFMAAPIPAGEDPGLSAKTLQLRALAETPLGIFLSGPERLAVPNLYISYHGRLSEEQRDAVGAHMAAIVSALQIPKLEEAGVDAAGAALNPRANGLAPADRPDEDEPALPAKPDGAALPLKRVTVDQGGKTFQLGKGYSAVVWVWGHRVDVDPPHEDGSITVRYEDQSVRVRPGETLPVGRSAHNGAPAIVIKRGSVSRRHAEVSVLEDGRIKVRDAGSRYGTSLDIAGPAAPTHPTPLHLGEPQQYTVPDQGMLAIRLPGDSGHADYIRVLHRWGHWDVQYGSDIRHLAPGKTLNIGRLPPEGPDTEALKIPSWKKNVSRDHMSLEFGENGNIRVTRRSKYDTEISRALRVTGLVEGWQQGVLGRIYAVDSGELLRVDMEEDSELARVHDGVRKKFSDLAAEKLRDPDTEELILKRTFKSLGKEIPYDKNRAAELEANPLHSMALGAANLNGEGGVCRHQALAAAAVLEALSADGYLHGTTHYVVGNGHAWVEYVSAWGAKYVLDIAQDYFGPLEKANFKGSRGKDQYANYDHPADGA